MEVGHQCGGVEDRDPRLDEVRDTIRQLERRLSEAEHRADLLQAALEEARANMAGLLGSRFWRSTAPARVMVRMARRIHRPLAARLRREIQRARDTASRVRRGVRLFWEALRHPPDFPTAETVAVSIIIPIRNCWRTTFACLKSIQEQTQGLNYEVIVVDNSSIDFSPLIFGGIKGLVYLRLARSRGFAGACRRGASKARGEFLVFLRQDTLVTQDWLHELLGTFTHFSGTGMAGSKVVRLEDRPTTTAIGNDEPDDPRVHFAREVEDCPDASVMVPADVFRKLGGIGTDPAPGAGEEINLAYRIRHQGHRLIYQPLSRVIQQGRPSRRVKERRRPDVLELSGPESPPWKVLVIDHIVPTSDRDSGSLRMFRILSILKRRGPHVTFLAPHTVDDRYTRDHQRIGVETLTPPHIASVDEYLKTHGKDYSMIWICRPELAGMFMDTARTFAPSAKLIFDTIDLHFLRVGREATLLGNPALREVAERLKEQELTIARKADFTIVVSQDEKGRVLEYAGPIDVRVVSNIHVVHPLANRFQDRKGILFIGGFNHTPNVDAVRYFVESIFPELRRTIPGVRFTIVGSNPPDSVRSLASEDIVVTGYVPDVSGYFRDSRLSVAPLRFGAGVKGKVNMSMAYGLPTVVTSIAAEGMFLVDGENALIADDPAAFIASVQRLYHSETLWAKLSANGLKNVEEHFSFEVVARELNQLLSDAGFAPPRPAVRVGATASSVAVG